MCESVVSIEEKLSASIQSGNFSTIAIEISKTCKAEELAEVLVRLHNSKATDILQAIIQDNEGMQWGYRFCRSLKLAMPNFQSSVCYVVECVAVLCEHEWAYDIVDGLRLFCERDAAVANEALELVLSNEKYSKFSRSVVISNFNGDVDEYSKKIIYLFKNKNSIIRFGAISALDAIMNKEGVHPSDDCLQELFEIFKNEQDQKVISECICFLITLSIGGKCDCDSLKNIFMTMSVKNKVDTIASACFEVWRRWGSVPSWMRSDIFILILSNIESEKLDIKPVDYILSMYLKDGDVDKVLFYCEKRLLCMADESVVDYENTCRELIESKDKCLDRFVTRWMLSREHGLCQAAEAVVSCARDGEVILAVDENELRGAEDDKLLFLARKIVGWFFMRPVVGCSYLMSLIPLVRSLEVRSGLVDLIGDYFLDNFPGKTTKYLESAMFDGDGQREAVDALLKRRSDYEKALSAMPEIPEIHPSEVERAAAHRKRIKDSAKIMKEAEKHSIFSKICSQVRVLYGNGAIYSVYGGYGEKRNEMEFSPVSTSMEYPSLAVYQIDDVEYATLIFRIEGLSK